VWDTPVVVDDCTAEEVCTSGASTCSSSGSCAGPVCGDGVCEEAETPDTCFSDCAPQFLAQERLGRDTNGDCSSTGIGWHPAGGIVYWTFGTSCALPSVWSPDVYDKEYGRWRFQIRKAGHYQVSVKVPPSSSACSFPLDRYATGAQYMLVRPGAPGITYTIDQQANVGVEATVTASISLNEGELALYLYDAVTDLASCCECTTTKRVFFDYARVQWVGP
jgi:hypothetical protein